METGASGHKGLRLAMLVVRRLHLRLDQIQMRCFEETTELAKVAPKIRRKAFAELAEIGPRAIDEVADALQEELPDRQAGTITAAWTSGPTNVASCATYRGPGKPTDNGFIFPREDSPPDCFLIPPHFLRQVPRRMQEPAMVPDPCRRDRKVGSLA
jgi:hypothetical protein